MLQETETEETIEFLSLVAFKLGAGGSFGAPLATLMAPGLPDYSQAKILNLTGRMQLE